MGITSTVTITIIIGITTAINTTAGTTAIIMAMGTMDTATIDLSVC